MKDVDGDDFSRSTRLGRAAAEAVVRAASGDAQFDGFSTARLIDHFVELSGGIASLPSVLSVLGNLCSAPLLASTRADDACERVHEAAHGSECGMLDLQLCSVAQSAILRGQTDAATVLESFISAFIEQISEYLAAARPSLQPRPARTAREVDRDLFAATR
ncbi:MAG: hypothetical protein E6J91_40120 [Deltaproteobacteria bacterium]|nr:MAG: hypothetical protein E6J91_40120 [Deltaproteobacteria bacterium]